MFQPDVCTFNMDIPASDVHLGLKRPPIQPLPPSLREGRFQAQVGIVQKIAHVRAFFSGKGKLARWQKIGGIDKIGGY